MGGAPVSSGGAETAIGDLVERDADEEAAAADTPDFAACVAAEREAAAAANFAE